MSYQITDCFWEMGTGLVVGGDCTVISNIPPYYQSSVSSVFWQSCYFQVVAMWVFAMILFVLFGSLQCLPRPTDNIQKAFGRHCVPSALGNTIWCMFPHS